MLTSIQRFTDFCDFIFCFPIITRIVFIAHITLSGGYGMRVLINCIKTNEIKFD